ncbi:hypothetical protein [Sphingobium sp. B2]|nr:hypothetical protein [Sphingobium sp. B2]
MEAAYLDWVGVGDARGIDGDFRVEVGNDRLTCLLYTSRWV